MCNKGLRFSTMTFQNVLEISRNSINIRPNGVINGKRYDNPIKNNLITKKATLDTIRI